MSNEQLIALIIANAATLFAVARWAMSRAIAYTHLERDVKELQDFKKLQEERHERMLYDLKGLSGKIDKRTNHTGPKPQ